MPEPPYTQMTHTTQHARDASPKRALYYSLYYQYNKHERAGAYARTGYKLPAGKLKGDNAARVWNRIARDIATSHPADAIKQLEMIGYDGNFGSLIKGLIRAKAIDEAIWTGERSIEPSMEGLVAINALATAVFLEIDLYHFETNATQPLLPADNRLIGNLTAPELILAAIDGALVIDEHFRVEGEADWPMMLFKFPVIVSWLVLEPDFFFGAYSGEEDQELNTWLKRDERRKLRASIRARLAEWDSPSWSYWAALEYSLEKLLRDQESVFHESRDAKEEGGHHE